MKVARRWACPCVLVIVAVGGSCVLMPRGVDAQAAGQPAGQASPPVGQPTRADVPRAPSIAPLGTPAILISLDKSAPIPENAVGVSLAAAVNFEVIAADAPHAVLVATEWIGADANSTPQKIEIGLLTAMALEGSKGVLFKNSPWLPLTTFYLMKTVRGSGHVQIALFEATISGTVAGGPVRFGRQLSNPLLLPATVKDVSRSPGWR